MKNAVATAQRLLTALETFVLQEHILLRSGHYAEMAGIQRRAAPVIARLCQLGREPGVETLEPRVNALLARRRENLSGLQQRRAQLNAARERLAARRQQLQNLASYCRPAAITRPARLNAAV